MICGSGGLGVDAVCVVCVSVASKEGCSGDILFFFFFNDTATTEIYTRSLVGSVRCV